MKYKIDVSFLRAAAIVVFVLLISAKAISQSMPPFQVQLTNGKTFSSKNLSPAAPIVIIYFAPDCEHCQLLMDALFKRIDDFRNAQIVMVTFKPLIEVVEFENHYQTHKYKNITVGTEVPVFFFRKYFQLENTPFTVLYSKDQRQIISYKKETPVDDLLKHLKQLK